MRVNPRRNGRNAPRDREGGSELRDCCDASPTIIVRRDYVVAATSGMRENRPRRSRKDRPRAHARVATRTCTVRTREPARKRCVRTRNIRARCRGARNERASPARVIAIANVHADMRKELIRKKQRKKCITASALPVCSRTGL